MLGREIEDGFSGGCNVDSMRVGYESLFYYPVSHKLAKVTLMTSVFGILASSSLLQIKSR